MYLLHSCITGWEGDDCNQCIKSEGCGMYIELDG